MKKTFVVFVVIAFLLTSCNFPLFSSTQAPNTNDISTRVAATLTAASPAVTLTLTPAEPAAQNTSTNTPESTATLTTTPTVTQTPTPAITDPKQTLGVPDYTWNASSIGNAFGLKGSPYEDEAVVISHIGAVTFTSKSINKGNRWRLSSTHGLTFYLEGTFTTGACTGFDNYGLVLQSPTYNDTPKFYFGVACNGQFVLQKWSGYSAENVISWSSDPKINAGPNQTNRLGILSENDSLKLYINGNLMGETSAASITAQGHFGANISARENPGFSFTLDELLEWEID